MFDIIITPATWEGGIMSKKRLDHDDRINLQAGIAKGLLISR